LIEVKVQRGEKVELVNIKEPLSKHQRAWYSSWANAVSKGTPDTVESFLNFRDGLIIELSNGNITKDELDNMPLIDKNAILEKIESRIKISEEKRDFTKG
jgi:hypothetical protein